MYSLTRELHILVQGDEEQEKAGTRCERREIKVSGCTWQSHSLVSIAISQPTDLIGDKERQTVLDVSLEPTSQFLSGSWEVVKWSHPSRLLGGREPRVRFQKYFKVETSMHIPSLSKYNYIYIYHTNTLIHACKTSNLLYFLKRNAKNPGQRLKHFYLTGRDGIIPSKYHRSNFLEDLLLTHLKNAHKYQNNKLR